MENVLCGNRVLCNDKVMFVERTSPETSVVVLTRPSSEPGENILSSESQSVGVFCDDWHMKKLHDGGNEFEVENDKVVNLCGILTFAWFGT
jgi:hypothetical protein